MLKNFTTVAVSLLGAVTTSVATMPTPSFAKISMDTQLLSIVNEGKSQETTTRLVVPEKPKEKRFICKDCNNEEKTTLNFLQDNGIIDKNALSVILGNIRQESTFVSNICEGGARVPYHRCISGGYGAIQWTSIDRYRGLGVFAARTGGDPSRLDTQLQYMLHEKDWKMIENQMKIPGQSINDYMRLARKWIRWGIHGARTNYAFDYSTRLRLIDVDS